MKRLLAFILLIVSLDCFAQVETDRYVIWQPGAKLTFEMFQGHPSDSAQVKKITDLHIYHEVAIGFWSVLDVPEPEGWEEGWEEKYSFCAAMDKQNSFFIVRDSTELKYAQLLWDVCELATRISRRNLVQFVDSIHEGMDSRANGAIAIQYMTCLNDGKEFGHELTSAIFHHVITTHDEARYKKIRDYVDSCLEELSAFATTEEEIDRLLTGKPQDGYKRAETLNPDLKNRGTIRY